MRILLAIDESPASQAAAKEVSWRLWPADSTVRVLHTVGKFVPPAQQLWYDAGGNLDQARQEIRDRFQTLVVETAKDLAEHDLKTETSIRDGEAGKTIIQEAMEWNADLTVMGSHRHGGMKRLLLGSVAQNVIDHAPCSVESAHQRQEDPHQEN